MSKAFTGQVPGMPRLLVLFDRLLITWLVHLSKLVDIAVGLPGWFSVWLGVWFALAAILLLLVIIYSPFFSRCFRWHLIVEQALID